MDTIIKSMGLQLPPLPSWLAQAADDIKSLILTGEMEPPIVINGSQYHLEEKIGEGGYSLVYSAREVVKDEHEDKARERESERMAVKESILGGSPEAEARCLAEVETMSVLQHPNILRLIGHCRVKNQATNDEAGYILTPLYTGSLESLRTFRRLTTREVLIVFTSLCSALAYCHERGTSHRDIKASNILLAHIKEEGDEMEEETQGSPRDDFEDHVSKITDVVICDWASAGPAKQPLPKTRQEARMIQEWAEANITASYRAIEGNSVALAALSHSVKFPFPSGDPKGYPSSFHEKVMACLELTPSNRPSAEELMSWAKEETRLMGSTQGSTERPTDPEKQIDGS